MANPQCGKDAVRISRELWRELWSGRHIFSPAETRALAWAIDVSWATFDPARAELPVGQRGRVTFECSGGILANWIGLSSEEEGRKLLRRLETRQIFKLKETRTGNQPHVYAVEKDYDQWLAPPGKRQGEPRANARVSAGQMPGESQGICQGEPSRNPAPCKLSTPLTKQGIQRDLQRSSSIKPCAPPARSLAPTPAPLHGARPPP